MVITITYIFKWANPPSISSGYVLQCAQYDRARNHTNPDVIQIEVMMGTQYYPEKNKVNKVSIQYCSHEVDRAAYKYYEWPPSNSDLNKLCCNLSIFIQFL